MAIIFMGCFVASGLAPTLLSASQKNSAPALGRAQPKWEGRFPARNKPRNAGTRHPYTEGWHNRVAGAADKAWNEVQCLKFLGKTPFKAEW
jgi:hypothetical protein